MNLGISQVNNTANCGPRRNATNFGMALKLDPSAHQVIKHQVVGLGEKSKNNFFEGIRNAMARMENNPVDVILRQSNRRSKALVAEVVDSQAGEELGGVKNQVVSQRLLYKNGSLGFLKTAEAKANKLNDTNNQIKKLIDDVPEATEADYCKAAEEAE